MGIRNKGNAKIMQGIETGSTKSQYFLIMDLVMGKSRDCSSNIGSSEVVEREPRVVAKAPSKMTEMDRKATTPHTVAPSTVPT